MIGISVIIPVYNKMEYLDKCINSVLNSTFCDLEVICIDDASTDGSRALLVDIQKRDNRVRVLENDVNMGVAITRNRGIEYSTGKYIFFLDADDYLEKDALQEYYSRLERADAQGCFLNLCIDNGNEVGIKCNYSNVYTGKEMLDLFIKNDEMFLYACGAVWKSDFIKSNQICFENLKVGEGGLFILEALIKADRVIFSDFLGYHYVLNDSSTNKNKVSMMWAALGQAKQIIYVILQLCQGESDRELVSFLIWYLRKNMGGINNLKISEIEDIDQLLPINERFLFDLIRGCYLGNSIELCKEDEELLKKCGKVYLYGAGYETLNVMRYCNEIGIEIAGIFVSSKENNRENIYGFPIWEFQEKRLKRVDIPFLITAHKKHQQIIRKKLVDAGIRKIIEL